MSIITTKFDNQLKQSSIEVPLIAPREEEMEIWTPIVAINDIVFDFDKVLRMNLYDDDRLPRIEVTIFDENKLLSGINNPSNDNELRLQILPPFEDAYKKINLTFYITNIINCLLIILLNLSITKILKHLKHNKIDFSYFI